MRVSVGTRQRFSEVSKFDVFIKVSRTASSNVGTLVQNALFRNPYDEDPADRDPMKS